MQDNNIFGSDYLQVGRCRSKVDETEDESSKINNELYVIKSIIIHYKYLYSPKIAY